MRLVPLVDLERVQDCIVIVIYVGLKRMRFF